MGHSDSALLDSVARAFAADDSELASLLGVEQSTVDNWRAHGVPTSARVRVDATVAVARLLTLKLKRGHVAQVVRRPSDAHGGLTILEMLAAGRHVELLDSVRESFDWATSA